jgi:hypothetical protein
MRTGGGPDCGNSDAGGPAPNFNQDDEFSTSAPQAPKRNLVVLAFGAGGNLVGGSQQ